MSWTLDNLWRRLKRKRKSEWSRLQQTMGYIIYWFDCIVSRVSPALTSGGVKTCSCFDCVTVAEYWNILHWFRQWVINMAICRIRFIFFNCVFLPGIITKVLQTAIKWLWVVRVLPCWARLARIVQCCHAHQRHSVWLSVSTSPLLSSAQIPISLSSVF